MIGSELLLWSLLSVSPAPVLQTHFDHRAIPFNQAVPSQTLQALNHRVQIEIRFETASHAGEAPCSLLCSWLRRSEGQVEKLQGLSG